MAHYLIVANQTLAGEKLARTVRDRIERGAGDSKFYVVVPMTPVEKETTAWTPPGEHLLAPPSPLPGSFEAVDHARKRSELRLDRMIEDIRSAGGEAEGEVGSADPVEAVKGVMQHKSFDEVIVSTLPAGISRWLKMDLPSRLSRMTQVPVTTIEAEE